MFTTTVSSEILNLQLATQIIITYGGLILVALGTIGNLLNILVFIRFKALRRMPNSTFLFTYFAASLVQLWTARFSRGILSLTGVDLLGLSPVYCHVRWLFGRMSSTITMTSICLSSIDRYLVTSRNVLYHHVFTTRRTWFIVSGIFFIYAVPYIPETIYSSGPSCTAPDEPYAYKKFVLCFNTIVSNILPVLVLTLFGTLTWRNLKSVRLTQRNRLEVQVNKMMFAELAMVCFTSLPNIVLNIYSLATLSIKQSQLRTAQDNLWSSLLNVINIATYCSSFYIFVSVSSTYRQNVRAVLCCKKQNRVRIQQNVSQSAMTHRMTLALRR